MPALDALYPYISYITAAGDEVILSCESYKKWWECYGHARGHHETASALCADGSCRRILPGT